MNLLNRGVAFSLTMLAVGCAAPLEEDSEAQTSILDETLTVLPTAAGQFIKIDGSSTVFPISHEAARRYQREDPNAPVIAVSFSGTGGGFQQFCEGETDINDASRPINTQEIADCQANGIEYIELPVALDAITVVVHPDNTWADDITLEELEKIWEPAAQGKITRWNQIRDSWPDRPLNLYGPGSDSGTFDYFTEVVVGESGDSRDDYTASEDDSLLVEKVSNDPDALAYFGLGYYAANWEALKSLAVDSGQEPVQPTVEAVKSLDYQPLTRPLFIYVNAEALEEKPELQTFVNYYLDDVESWVPFVGYVPLSEATYNLASERFEQRRLGSVYAGQLQPELTLENLLQAAP